MRIEFVMHDRVIVFEAGDTLDAAGQFPVTALIDGKVRWAAHFTSHDPRDRTPAT